MLYGLSQGQEELVYPKPDDPWCSDVNIFNPDYTKFPKYKEATPIEFTVGAGEMLCTELIHNNSCNAWRTKSIFFTKFKNPRCQEDNPSLPITN